VIKLRMIIESEVGIKEKLPSKFCHSVPRIGEHICYLKRDFKVSDVAWDLEMLDPEAVLLLVECETR
jgi:hypothetical protein